MFSKKFDPAHQLDHIGRTHVGSQQPCGDLAGFLARDYTVRRQPEAIAANAAGSPAGLPPGQARRTGSGGFLRAGSDARQATTSLPQRRPPLAAAKTAFSILAAAPSSKARFGYGRTLTNPLDSSAYLIHISRLPSSHPRVAKARTSVGGKTGGNLMGTLTAVAVRGLRTEGKHLDGQGLALVIDCAGRRYWQYRYQRAGRERVMSFGSADDVTLAAARKLHAEARAATRRQGPLEERDRAKLDLTRRFAEVAEAYITAHEPRWRGPHSARQWRANLRDHVYPAIGKMPVAEIDVHHVLRVLKPIWGKKQVTASRVRSRIEMVLDYATALGWRTGANPAVWRGGLRSLLPAEADLHTVTHFAALNWCDMPALLVELGACDSMPARTLTLLIYVPQLGRQRRAVRSGARSISIGRYGRSRRHA